MPLDWILRPEKAQGSSSKSLQSFAKVRSTIPANTLKKILDELVQLLPNYQLHCNFHDNKSSATIR
jgi:hypothetical protein